MRLDRPSHSPALFALLPLAAALPLSAQAPASAPDREVALGTLSDVTAFELGAPLFRVGHSAGAEGHIFTQIAGGTLLPDGSAVVGDVGSLEVVWLSPEGRILHVLGRQGQGPGEFTEIVSVTFLPPDTVAVEDDSNGRMTYYVNGRLARTENFGDRALSWPLVVLGWHGTSITLGTYAKNTGFPEEWLQGAVVRFERATASLDTIAHYDAARRLGSSGTSVPNPYRPAGRLTAKGSMAAIVRQDRTWIDVIDLHSGRRIRLSWNEDPPSASDAFWAIYEGYAQSRGLPEARYGAAARRATLSEPVPVVGDVHIDGGGRIWVSRYGPDPRRYRRYRVFEGERWLGWVELPDRIDILDISTNRLLAIQRDEFDVESVVVFPIAPAGGR